MSLNIVEVIKAIHIQVDPNKGVSLEEELKLDRTPRPVFHPKMNEAEAVGVARKHVYNILGRKNITPRDLKKALVRMF